MNPSLLILLFIAFIDFMGMGLIYPIFSVLLFDHALPFLPSHTTEGTRGLWLGILYALMPLGQLFSAPIWGALSDKLGRKKPLFISLGITMTGHAISILGVFWGDILILLFSRIILGIGCGNISIVQASIADLSSEKEKTKNFGLLTMAIGAAFTLGPFFGGFFSRWGFSLPFFFATLVTAINLILAKMYFRETLLMRSEKKLSWAMGLHNLKKAVHSPHIRVILFCAFLGGFAWSFFMDFFPIYLMKHFQFSSGKIGLFYGAIGGFYALSAGLLIRPLLSRLKPETLLFAGSLGMVPCLVAIPFFPSAIWLLPFAILYTYSDALVYPTTTAIVSNNASADIQGEALGILASVLTASYALSALSASVLIGLNPALAIWVAAGSFLAAALVVLAHYRSRLFTQHPP